MTAKKERKREKGINHKSGESVLLNPKDSEESPLFSELKHGTVTSVKKKKKIKSLSAQEKRKKK